MKYVHFCELSLQCSTATGLNHVALRMAKSFLEHQQLADLKKEANNFGKNRHPKYVLWLVGLVLHKWDDDSI